MASNRGGPPLTRSQGPAPDIDEEPTRRPTIEREERDGDSPIGLEGPPASDQNSAAPTTTTATSNPVQLGPAPRVLSEEEETAELTQRLEASERRTALLALRRRVEEAEAREQEFLRVPTAAPLEAVGPVGTRGRSRPRGRNPGGARGRALP